MILKAFHMGHATSSLHFSKAHRKKWPLRLGWFFLQERGEGLNRKFKEEAK